MMIPPHVGLLLGLVADHTGNSHSNLQPDLDDTSVAYNQVYMVVLHNLCWLGTDLWFQNFEVVGFDDDHIPVAKMKIMKLIAIEKLTHSTSEL